MTMNFDITENERAFLREAVASGTYSDENEVIHAALRLLEDEHSAAPHSDSIILQMAQVARDQVARGEYTEVAVDELDAFMDEIEREIDSTKAA